MRTDILNWIGLDWIGLDEGGGFLSDGVMLWPCIMNNWSKVL